MPKFLSRQLGKNTPTHTEGTQSLAQRHVYFAVFVVASAIAASKPLADLMTFSMGHEHASHLFLIPFIAAVLVYLDRKRIFRDVQSAFALGTVLSLSGLGAYWLAIHDVLLLNQNDRFFLTALSLVTIWIGAFIALYGKRSFRAALAPLLFLLFMVPLPTAFLEKAIAMLQMGSAETTDFFFKLAGVPVLREGLTLSLPGFTIEVAKECSGIRSSLALLITGLLAGHLFLATGWQKFILTVAILPVLVIKNGFRIVTLSLLAVHVDAGFLTGDLHRQGGVVFFLLAIALLFPVLWLLMRSERKSLRFPPTDDLLKG